MYMYKHSSTVSYIVPIYLVKHLKGMVPPVSSSVLITPYPPDIPIEANPKRQLPCGREAEPGKYWAIQVAESTTGCSRGLLLCL